MSSAIQLDMEVPDTPWVKKLSSSELCALARESDCLSEEALLNIEKKGICGRHLKRLTAISGEELNRYGLSLGDLMDLIEIVVEKSRLRSEQTVSASALSSINFGASTSGCSTSTINVDSILRSEETASSCSSSNLGASTLGCSTSTINIDNHIRKGSVNVNSNQDKWNESDWETADNVSRKGSANPNANKDKSKESPQSSQSSTSSSSSRSTVIASDDEVFVNFAKPQDVHKLTNYERKSAKAKINNYNRMKDFGLNPSKPILGIPGEQPGTSKSASREERSGVREKEKGKKSHKSNKDKKESRDSTRKDRKRRREDKENNPSSDEEVPSKKHKSERADKDSAQKLVLKKYLQNPLNRKYLVVSILTAVDDSKDKACVETLVSKGVVFDENLRRVVALLLKHLYDKAKSPSLVTSDMREGMAVSLVGAFPKMANAPIRTTDLPWTWLFDRANNTGKFAHHHANKQRQDGTVRLRGGGSSDRRRKAKPDTQPVVQYLVLDDVPRSKEAVLLAMVRADDGERNNIENLMEKTFDERRDLVNNVKCSTRLLLFAFPHLKSFEGRMIDREFSKLYGEEKNHLFLKDFQDYVPLLLKLASVDPKKYSKDQCFIYAALNSMLVLSKFLPRPKRVYSWEESMTTLPSPDDFVEVVPIGSRLEEKMLEKRTKAGGAVQPYIIATGTCKKFESLALALGDGHYITLPPDTMPVRAVDLLIKAHYVLGSHYCLGWKNVYRFVSYYLYKLAPEKTSGRLSTFVSEYKKLMNV
ncbi:Calpain-type cysteine protease DEK1 [Frankliniella fusca]|uniref:Calpain-type cysteine protease DEK1 n=1 Tax=Frankliniella fusca TaxID=407009 RepID=A0AAE1H2W0_9NEOP|nr:Calpain-type cysteine protease DEK1 [Frankliniella fusca]